MPIRLPVYNACAAIKPNQGQSVFICSAHVKAFQPTSSSHQAWPGQKPRVPQVKVSSIKVNLDTPPIFLHTVNKLSKEFFLLFIFHHSFQKDSGNILLMQNHVVIRKTITISQVYLHRMGHN